jgi:hypothetical protein
MEGRNAEQMKHNNGRGHPRHPTQDLGRASTAAYDDTDLLARNQMRKVGEGRIPASCDRLSGGR